MAPTVNEAVCRGGVLLAPTLALAQTDRIAYSVDRSRRMRRVRRWW